MFLYMLKTRYRFIIKMCFIYFVVSYFFLGGGGEGGNLVVEIPLRQREKLNFHLGLHKQ